MTKRYPSPAPIQQDIINAYFIMEETELMKSFRLKRPVTEEFSRKLKWADSEIGAKPAGNLERCLTAVPLVAHEAFSTAYLNDADSHGVFTQQFFVFGRKGDVFLGISTSENSKNIINAAVTAKASDIKVIALNFTTAAGFFQDLTVVFFA